MRGHRHSTIDHHHAPLDEGKDGEADVSVPIYDAYNHHYCAWLLGKDAEMRNVKAANDQARYINHGASAVWIAAPKNNTDNHDEGLNTLPDSFKTTPSSQWFSEGNGGEFRKSYHGYPKKYAQLIKEPTTFTIQPMQIDTHNREYKGPGFKAGPLPKANTPSYFHSLAQLQMIASIEQSHPS